MEMAISSSFVFLYSDKFSRSCRKIRCFMLNRVMAITKAIDQYVIDYLERRRVRKRVKMISGASQCNPCS